MFLSIYGSVLLFFVSYLLLLENPDPKVADTTLYFLNGKSVPLQAFDGLYSLSPKIMRTIYFLVILGVLISLKFNKFYLAVSTGNLILSIPIFMVNKNTLFFKPFYSDGIVSYSGVLNWVWYIYLSLLGIILLIFYIAIKNDFKWCH